MTSSVLHKLVAVLIGVGIAAAAGLSEPPEPADSAPTSNLDYWLRHEGEGSTTQGVAPPASEESGRSFARTAPALPFGSRLSGKVGTREDAVPGVAALSDGSIAAGELYTTRDRDFEVWVESEQRWRHVPLLTVLSIEAVVIEEGMDKEWRWKEMGSDEKVFTGRSRPVRRFRWRFHLIDDSVVTGDVKGQPLWVQTPEKPDKPLGPYILHERSNGGYGQSLADLVYLQRVLISRRAMDAARKSSATRPASAAAPPTDTR